MNRWQFRPSRRWILQCHPSIRPFLPVPPVLRCPAGAAGAPRSACATARSTGAAGASRATRPSAACPARRAAGAGVARAT